MSTVEEILEAINELPPEKRNELRRRLVFVWDNLSSNRAFITPNTPVRPRVHPRRPAIKIKGKPISETVIEDRR